MQRKGFYRDHVGENEANGYESTSFSKEKKLIPTTISVNLCRNDFISQSKPKVFQSMNIPHETVKSSQRLWRYMTSQREIIQHCLSFWYLRGKMILVQGTKTLEVLKKLLLLHKNGC